MIKQQQLDADHRMRVVGDDEIVLDFGADTEGTIDVVDTTAIVLVEDDQYEFELDRAVERSFIHNGVLTIELS